MKIRLLGRIAPVGLEELGGRYEVGQDMENPDGILVRSAVLHDMPFGENLAAIARAGAGVNNIPVDRCSEAGIVVFNTPGANANGVRELTICALLLAARDVIGGPRCCESGGGWKIRILGERTGGKNAWGHRSGRDRRNARKQRAGAWNEGDRVRPVSVGGRRVES